MLLHLHSVSVSISRRLIVLIRRIGVIMRLDDGSVCVNTLVLCFIFHQFIEAFAKINNPPLFHKKDMG